LERALAVRGRKELLPLLRERLRNPASPPEHVRSAPESLAALGDRECIPDFIRLLESESPYLRSAAVKALTTLRAREALPAMEKLLGKSESDTWQIAEWMVALDEREKVGALRKAMGLCSPPVKSHIAGALVRLGSFEEVPLVLEWRSGWTDLNALRCPKAWRLLTTTSLPSRPNSTVDAVLIQLEKDTGLKVEWPENPYVGTGDSSPLDYTRSQSPALSGLDIVKTLAYRTSSEVVLEEGMIRIISRPKAQTLWKEWAALVPAK
jgi:hypothetical protein